MGYSPGVSKSIWVIFSMGGVTALLLAVGMMMSLGQFQGAPAAEWVRLAESITRAFNLEKVAVRVDISSMPTSLTVSYITRADSKFDITQQNAEMEHVARFAAEFYKGRDAGMIEQVKIARSETHGSGCFQQTYVANFTLANPRRRLQVEVTPGFAPPSRRDP